MYGKITNFNCWTIYRLLSLSQAKINSNPVNEVSVSSQNRPWYKPVGYGKDARTVELKKLWYPYLSTMTPETVNCLYIIYMHKQISMPWSWTLNVERWTHHCHQCHPHGTMCILSFILILSWLMVYIISRLYLGLQVEGTRMAMAANIEHQEYWKSGMRHLLY